MPPRYKVLEEIGRGGMGVVFRTYDRRLQREVALKVLLPEDVVDRELEARFQREAEACSRVVSPHVVKILDWGKEADGRLYYTMDLVRGESLSRLLEEGGRLAIAEAVALLEQALLGLSAVHGAGLVHRDLKPHNIMVGDDERVRILDFGLVKVADATLLTREGGIVGTALYMAPERFEAGATVGSAADIYALGMTWWQLLTGRHWLANLPLAEVVQSLTRDEVPSLRSIRPEVPVWLDELIRACSDRVADQRPSAVEALATLGEHVASSRPATGPCVPESPIPRQTLERDSYRSLAPSVVRAVWICLAAIILATVWRSMGAAPRRVEVERPRDRHLRTAPPASSTEQLRLQDLVYWPTESQVLIDFYRDPPEDLDLIVEPADTVGQTLIAVAVRTGSAHVRRELSGLPSGAKLCLSIVARSLGAGVRRIPFRTLTPTQAAQLVVARRTLVTQTEEGQMVAKILELYPDVRSLTDLMSALRAGSGHTGVTRETLAKVLERLRPRHLAGQIAEVIQVEPASNVRAALIEALGAMRDPVVVATARTELARIRSVSGHDSSERLVRALGLSRLPQAFDCLTRAESPGFDPNTPGLGEAIARCDPRRALLLATELLQVRPLRGQTGVAIDIARWLQNDEGARILTPLLDPSTGSAWHPRAVRALSSMGASTVTSILGGAIARWPLDPALLIAASHRAPLLSIAPLTVALRPEQPAEVRIAAACGLGIALPRAPRSTAYSHAMEALAEAARGQEQVAAMALWALGAIGTVEARSILSAQVSASPRPRALLALSRSGGSAAKARSVVDRLGADRARSPELDLDLGFAIASLPPDDSLFRTGPPGWLKGFPRQAAIQAISATKLRAARASVQRRLVDPLVPLEPTGVWFEAGDLISIFGGGSFGASAATLHPAGVTGDGATGSHDACLRPGIGPVVFPIPHVPTQILVEQPGELVLYTRQSPMVDCPGSSGWLRPAAGLAWVEFERVETAVR